MTRTIILTLVLLSGCKALDCPRYTYDREAAERIFLECLSRSQHGPTSLTASGNDLDEVVAECRYAAWDLSRTLTESCEGFSR